MLLEMWRLLLWATVSMANDGPSYHLFFYMTPRFLPRLTHTIRMLGLGTGAACSIIIIIYKYIYIKQASLKKSPVFKREASRPFMA